ncbi:hypothetical protein EYF80_031382 [Liparis tanakae]|uniref:Uncharacterized protein n=1 Tax=Liparis tanakae TaxID=230148 RepID=A0A4Z2GYK1_9TELE|nr:hypothetical protein EYF80_031382 [Liparis tanakae]
MQVLQQRKGGERMLSGTFLFRHASPKESHHWRVTSPAPRCALGPVSVNTLQPVMQKEEHEQVMKIDFRVYKPQKQHNPFVNLSQMGPLAPVSCEHTAVDSAATRCIPPSLQIRQLIFLNRRVLTTHTQLPQWGAGPAQRL